MTPQPDELERSLRELTAWDGPAPGLWRAALSEHAARPRRTWRLLNTPIPGGLSAAAAVIILFFVAATLMLTTLGRARRAPDAAWSPIGVQQDSLGLGSSEPPPAASVAGIQQGQVEWAETNSDQYPPPASESSGQEALRRAPAAAPTPQSAPADRHVVRTATIELVSPDVPAAFARAAHLVSDARGEYVQSSSLSGEGPTSRATLTLRIAADRLSDAMNDLRQLGKVRDERTTGEDVTAQVVDLEARLRNEQRVESELLELLSNRNDAPLKDILELRESLSRIRQTIEQITAQRERLSRLVSLSTVLVIIRPTDEAPRPAAGSTLGAYFIRSVAKSWRAGLVFLADTLSGILAVLVGGLVWWLLAAAILIAFLRQRRRSSVLPPA